MTKDERDYSDYVQHTISMYHGQLFMLGFMFAVFAIVLTQLPDPNALHTQLVLLFFSTPLGLIGLLAAHGGSLSLYFCRRIPPLSKRIAAFNTLSSLLTLLEIGTATLLFALWNLPNLVIASGIGWVVFAIAHFVLIIRPFRKWRKTVH